MKRTLHWAILLIVLISCSKSSDPAPTPTTYTSLEGKWKFATKAVSANGNFKIANISGVLTVDSDYGQFTINGKKYIVGKRQKIELGKDPGTFNRMWLLDADVLNQFVFDNVQASSDFTTLTAKSFFYVENDKPSTSFTETVVITRE